MKIEGYSQEEMIGIVTLKNAIQARRVYEEARLEKPTKETVTITHGKDKKIKAGTTEYQIFCGMEAGARQQLYSQGKHIEVHEIYKSLERQTESGE